MGREHDNKRYHELPDVGQLSPDDNKAKSLIELFRSICVFWRVADRPAIRRLSVKYL